MASHTPDKPNILLLLSDDHGCWAMGCAGNAEIRTPNLDRLAETGVRFSRFFCTSPVCSPARASILTGRMPSFHGVHDWIAAGNSSIESPDGKGERIEYLRGLTAYTDLLAHDGYVCGLSGKWHLGDAHRPQKGLTFWEAHAQGGGPYHNAPMIRNGRVIREPEYITDVITDHALDFLDSQARTDAPFYLSVHYTAPHSPWEREHHPAEIFDSYFSECAFDSVPQRPMHPRQVAGLIAPDGSNRREILSGYYAAVTAMDACIGELLDWLEDNHLRDNTLVLYLSDNGMNMGHHGIWGKGNGTSPLNLFDTSVLVPAMASWPGRVRQGVVDSALHSQYDIMPTLLDCCGIACPDAKARPGHSFAPALRGEVQAEPRHVVVYDEYGPARMIRSEDWKYIHRHPDGPHELYHLADDPDEDNNLADEPACRERIARMRSELEAWFARHVDPARDGKALPVVGRGQINLVGKEHAFRTTPPPLLKPEA